ncbi:uncharacterized protein SCHCODRAFT_01212886 [Schizophyllum commune H4-8]|uniref:uncharacterized protein n=1 Tax=Schizophyllum commune (strain H4-8 / FGSC 9210) TaxID=578458 RepID=UPI00215E9AE1|nr:uncharacterized protein SCHCODRAFT_01212886 [Schizophyllum commune H4-8]KAI5892181.1 hypothetical protein SCHCODRAFT_01212886 [Schizophyllum commune H4-8]
MPRHLRLGPHVARLTCNSEDTGINGTQGSILTSLGRDGFGNLLRGWAATTRPILRSIPCATQKSPSLPSTEVLNASSKQKQSHLSSLQNQVAALTLPCPEYLVEHRLQLLTYDVYACCFCDQVLDRPIAHPNASSYRVTALVRSENTERRRQFCVHPTVRTLDNIELTEDAASASNVVFGAANVVRVTSAEVVL